LAGVYSRVGFTGAVVGIDVSWGEGLDVNESSLGARGYLIGGVNVLGDDVGNTGFFSTPLFPISDVQ